MIHSWNKLLTILDQSHYFWIQWIVPHLTWIPTSRDSHSKNRGEKRCPEWRNQRVGAPPTQAPSRGSFCKIGGNKRGKDKGRKKEKGKKEGKRINEKEKRERKKEGHTIEKLRCKNEKEGESEWGKLKSSNFAQFRGRNLSGSYARGRVKQMKDIGTCVFLGEISPPVKCHSCILSWTQPHVFHIF